MRYKRKTSVVVMSALLESCSDLTVEFSATRLRHATVVWLDPSWQPDADPTERPWTDQEINDWLIANCAFSVQSDSDSPAAYSDESRIFLADRYGYSVITPFGGSGRAGIVGSLQLKGIGPTPLASSQADWFHSHGYCWLEEALREAVYARLAHLEFPHGAARVVAVIDSGLNYSNPNGGVGERRAIIVRESIVRLSHFERAPGFQPVVNQSLAQIRDVARTKQAIAFMENLSAARSESLLALFCAAFERIGEQIAYGHVGKIYQGDYFSDNLGFYGDLLDFGSTRAVDDWVNVAVDPKAPAFGDEHSSLVRAASSVCTYLSKYSGELKGVSIQAELYASATLGYKQARSHFLKLMANGGRGATIPQTTKTLTLLLQRFCNDDWGFSGANAPLTVPSYVAVRMRPRSNLRREELQQFLFRNVGGDHTTKGAQRSAASHAVRIQSLLARRYWPGMPSRLTPIRRGVWDRYDVVLCEPLGTPSRMIMWIEIDESSIERQTCDQLNQLPRARAFRHRYGTRSAIIAWCVSTGDRLTVKGRFGKPVDVEVCWVEDQHTFSNYFCPDRDNSIRRTKSPKSM